jgi:HD-GYP domain-containing protein (c-di-GMP phosphodiesterase class II)
LTSDRPYRKAASHVEAKRVLREEAGVRLDSNAVAALFAAVEMNLPTMERITRPLVAF